MVWPIASALVAFGFLSFFHTNFRTRESLVGQLETDTAEILVAVEHALEQNGQPLQAVRAFFAASEEVNAAEFRTFAARLLRQSEATEVLAWSPRLRLDDRASYEAAGPPGFSVFELDDAGRARAAGVRAEYFPLTFVEARSANAEAIGFDLASDRLRFETLSRACDAAEPRITPQLRLASGDGKRMRHLIVQPVYRGDGMPADVAERREMLRGVATAAIQVDRVVQAALHGMTPHDVEVHLLDVSGARPELLVSRPSRSGHQVLSPRVDPAALERGLHDARVFDSYGRRWKLIVCPGPAYARSVGGTIASVRLLNGLVAAAVFLAYVRMRQQRDRRLREAEERYRSLIEQTPAVVYEDEVGGDWRYISPQIESVLGYTPKEFSERRTLWKDCIHPDDLPRVLDSTYAHLGDGARIELEYRIRNRQGEIVWIRDTAEALRDTRTDAWLLRGVMHDVTGQKRAEAERQAMLEIMQGLVDAPDARSFVELAHQALSRVISAENFFAVLQSPDTGRFEMLYLADRFDQADDGDQDLGRSLTAYVFRKGEPLIVSEEEYAALIGSGEVEAIGTPSPSWMGAPLRIGDRCIGVIVVQDYERTDAYSARDRDFLNSVAAQVAAAIARNRTERALRASEERYRTISDNTPDVIWTLDLERQRFTYVSPSVARLRGYSAEEALEQPLENALTPESYRRLLGIIEAEHPAPGDEPRTVELEVVRRDGSVVPAEVTTQVVRDAAGRLQVVGVTRDITERKRADEALRKSQAGLELAQSVAHIGSWEFDPATGTGTWSNELFRLLKCDPARGTPAWSEFLMRVHPEDRQLVERRLSHCAETGEKITCEYRSVHAGPDSRHFEARAFAIRDESGAVVRLAGTVSDITERKVAEIQREALLAIIAGAAATSDTAEFLALLHRELKPALRAEHMLVLLDDRKTGRLEEAYRSPLIPAYGPGVTRSPAAWVLRRGESVIVTSELLESLYASGEVDPVEGAATSLMVAPLRRGERVVGAVALLDWELSDCYTERDRVFLDSVAAQVALAIERQQTRQELLENDARLREAQRIAQIGVFEHDVERDVHTWSDQTYRIYGLEPQSERMTLERIRSFIHPADREKAAPLENAMVRGQSLEHELRIVRADGQERILVFRSEFVFAPDGRPVRQLGTVQDITERREATARIRQLSQVVDQMDDGVVITDTNGVIQYVNAAFERSTGYAREEALGRTPRILNSGLMPRGYFTELWATILRGEPFHGEFLNRRRNGELYYEAKTITPVRDENGAISRFVATAKDITARKKAEHDLKERLKEMTCLREVQRLLERGLPLEELCRRIAEQIAVAMQFPDAAITEVELDGTGYSSAPERRVAGPLLRSPISAANVLCGSLSVGYADAGLPLVEEEQHLLDGIAHSLGLWLERQRADAALRRSEERLRTIFDSVGTGLWEQDFTAVWELLDRLRGEGVTDLRAWLHGNPRVVLETAARVKLLGVNRAGRELHEIGPGDDVDAIFERIMRNNDAGVLAEEFAAIGEGVRHFASETESVRKDGSKVAVWLTLTVPEDRRQPVVLGTVDISERKRAEAALQEAQALYRTIFDVSLDGLAIFDEGFRVVVCNGTGATLYRRTVDQMLGLGILDLVAPEEREQTRGRVLPIVQTGLAHGEFTAVRRDGTRFPAEFALIRIPPAGDRGTMFVGVTRDITERQRDAALQRTQFAVSRVLIEATSMTAAAPEVLAEVCDGLRWDAGEYWRLDPGRGELELRSTWSAHGTGAEGGAGILRETTLPIGEEVARKVATTAGPLWIADLAAEGGLQAEQPLSVASLVALPILATGEMVGVMVLYALRLRDREEDTLQALLSVTRQMGLFSARRRAEADLAAERNSLARRVEERTADLTRVNTELERAVRAKDEFLANMSHELRTPLNAILALSETLLEQIRGPLNEKQQLSVRTIEASGRHLLAVITDILDLSKVEAGRIDLQFEPVQISAVCEQSLALVREIAARKQLKLGLQLSDHMGVIDADPKRLKQMLVNLLSNAVKFTDDGGRVSLEAVTDLAADVVRFSVRDTGIGISPEDLSRLFQPFTQLDSKLSRQYEGTGLGLALTRRLAELHGGDVEVESEPGLGSCFTIVLPIGRPAAAEAAAEAGRKPAAALPPMQSALIVEDSRAAAEQISRYLGEISIASVVHDSGEGAVDRTAELQPDVIFLDLLLPERTGWEVLEELKADERTRAIPVIIASVVDDRVRGLAAGAAEYLVKPITRDALQTALARAVQPHHELQNAVIIEPAPVEPRLEKILLADDGEFNIIAIGDYLKDMGYELIVARNGVEAVALAEATHPDLILMDVQMPEVDGLEATRRLRLKPEFAEVPIIALTGLAMPGDRELCLAAGASDYLSKPVSPRNLVQTIRKLMKPVSKV